VTLSELSLIKSGESQSGESQSGESQSGESQSGESQSGESEGQPIDKTQGEAEPRIAVG
jgi:hypothetical protein